MIDLSFFFWWRLFSKKINENEKVLPETIRREIKKK
jgi:hypothetical protein